MKNRKISRPLSLLMTVLLLVPLFSSVGVLAANEGNTGDTLIAVNTGESAQSFSFGKNVQNSINASVSSAEEEAEEAEEPEVYDIYTDENGNTLTALAPDLPDPVPVETGEESGEGIDASVSAETKEYKVGDSFSLYEYYAKERISMKCLYVGTHCTVWGSAEGEEQGDIRLSAENAQTIGQEFDSKYAQVQEVFGTVCADPDGDGKLAIMCYDIGEDYKKATEDFSGTYTGGYFYSVDLISSDYRLTIGDKSVKYSEEGIKDTTSGIDCIHIDTWPAMGAKYDEPFTNIERAYSTLFHEYQHMLFFSNCFVKGNNYTEDLTWLNEALSMASEQYFCGADSTASRITYFNNEEKFSPEAGLLTWSDGKDTLSHYSLSYLFGQYVRTRYKQETGNDNFFQAIYQSEKIGTATESVDGLELVAELLKEDPEELLRSFWVACLLKESAGDFGFAGEEWAEAITPIVSSKEDTTIGAGSARFYSASLSTEKSTGNIVFDAVKDQRVVNTARLTISAGQEANLQVTTSTGKSVPNGGSVRVGTTLVITPKGEDTGTLKLYNNGTILFSDAGPWNWTMPAEDVVLSLNNHVHSWSEWQETNPASCTEKGTESRTCSSCQITETRDIAAKGHSWGDWTVTREAGCTETGSETRSCTVCPTTETRDIAAKGHSWGEWQVTNPASCTEKGTETRSCKDCTATETQDIPALGHNYVDNQCTRCGAEKPSSVFDRISDMFSRIFESIRNVFKNFFRF